MEIKEKEKRYYTQIIDDFFSKVSFDKRISLNNITFSLFSDVNYEIYHGVTKIVLVPKQKGARYVIKMPMKRNDEWDISEDWCAAEVDVYQSAEDYGVEDFFAETAFFMNYNKCPVYIQERTRRNPYDDDGCDWYEPTEDWSRIDEETKESAEELNICDQLIDELLRDYDDKQVLEFLNFCQNEYINDLHSGNFGYDRRTGGIKIYDYSGIGSIAKRMRGME